MPKTDAPEPGWAVANSGWLPESPTGSWTGPITVEHGRYEI